MPLAGQSIRISFFYLGMAGSDINATRKRSPAYELLSEGEKKTVDSFDNHSIAYDIARIMLLGVNELASKNHVHSAGLFDALMLVSNHCEPFCYISELTTFSEELITELKKLAKRNVSSQGPVKQFYIDLMVSMASFGLFRHVKDMLKIGYSVNATNSLGASMLSVAADLAHATHDYSMIDFLIEHGASAYFSKNENIFQYIERTNIDKHVDTYLKYKISLLASDQGGKSGNIIPLPRRY